MIHIQTQAMMAMVESARASTMGMEVMVAAPEPPPPPRPLRRSKSSLFTEISLDVYKQRTGHANRLSDGDSGENNGNSGSVGKLVQVHVDGERDNPSGFSILYMADRQTRLFTVRCYSLLCRALFRSHASSSFLELPPLIIALNPPMIPSASLPILATRASHVGMSLINPTAIPALTSALRWHMTYLQIPASTSPSSYTLRPRAPATSSRRSSNLAPPGRRSNLTTSTETLFLTVS